MRHDRPPSVHSPINRRQVDHECGRVFDSFGNIVAEAHYNTSGAVVTAGQTGFATVAFAFTGRYFDADTGLQSNLNRWYDAETGAWLSEDPIGFNGDASNLNRYGGNKPTLMVDPSGLGYNLIQGVSWSDWWRNFKHYANPFITHHAVDKWDCALQWGTRVGQGAAVIGATGAVALDAAFVYGVSEVGYVPLQYVAQQAATEIAFWGIGGAGASQSSSGSISRSPGSSGIYLSGYSRPGSVLPPSHVLSESPVPPSRLPVPSVPPSVGRPGYNPYTDPSHIFSDPLEWPIGWTPWGGFTH